jgi:hypothetical protein
MSAPGWLRWAFATAMVAVAVYHLARLVGSRRPSRRAPADVELTHSAMGVVMTVMLVGTLAPSDSRRLALMFAVPALWFLWRGLRSYVLDGARATGAPARQVLGCAAMVYMLVALAGSGPAMAGMPRSAVRVPSAALGAALVIATLAVAAWTVLRARAVRCAETPALNTGCQLAMNVTTVYMLMAM